MQCERQPRNATHKDLDTLLESLGVCTCEVARQDVNQRCRFSPAKPSLPWLASMKDGDGVLVHTKHVRVWSV